ncbi:MAG: YraN family protein [Lachnospiraceae bacterium]
MQNNRKVGEIYELLAVRKLEECGYEILEKNFRCRQGEIDVIAKHRETLVFIEVKYRKNASRGYAAEAVTFRKQNKICRTADYYLNTHFRHIPMCRFDVVAIDGEKITIYENAFEYIPGGYR